MSHTRFLVVVNLIGQIKLHNRWGDSDSVEERCKQLETYMFDWWKETDPESLERADELRIEEIMHRGE